MGYPTGIEGNSSIHIFIGEDDYHKATKFICYIHNNKYSKTFTKILLKVIFTNNNMKVIKQYYYKLHK